MSIVFFRPADDKAAKVLATWGQSIANLARAHGHMVVDIGGSSVTRTRVDTEIQLHDHVVWFGHGLDDELIAYGAAMIDKSNLSTNQTEICIAISCYAAVDLRQTFVGSVGSAFVGFDDEFTVPAKAPLPMQLAIRNGLDCLFTQAHNVGCATFQLRVALRDLRDDYKINGSSYGLTAGETRLAWMCAKNNQYSLQLIGDQSAVI